MTEGDLRKFVSEAIAEHPGKDARWIAHDVITTLQPAGVDVSDFHRICSYGHVRFLIRSEIQRGKRKEDDTGDDEDQLILPGFVHVQRQYLIPREMGDGDEKQIVPVPIEQMTGDEILAKVGELRAMASGCEQHANELLRYYEQRVASFAKENAHG